MKKAVGGTKKRKKRIAEWVRARAPPAGGTNERGTGGKSSCERDESNEQPRLGRDSWETVLEAAIEPGSVPVGCSRVRGIYHVVDMSWTKECGRAQEVRIGTRR